MTQCPVCESRHLEAECSTCTASRQAAAADDNVRLLVDIEVQPADAAQPRALARALAQRVIADLRRRGPWPGPVDRLARQLA